MHTQLCLNGGIPSNLYNFIDAESTVTFPTNVLTVNQIVELAFDGTVKTTKV